ncbi:MAG: efflux RND transporter periplasmic adaptor subunit [Actinomycetota bacterium]|nr:efflux RND transporter periplasmic adaptor subunit [Actinomycetota bacterium]
MEGPLPAAPSVIEDRPVENGSGPSAPKEQLKRSTRVGLTVIGVLALLAVIGFAAAYLLNSRNYVTTDNAQVDGDKITINAPASGTLINWDGTQGTVVRRDQPLGRIKMDVGFVSTQKPIKAPGAGTIAVDNGVEGAWVAAGTQLATAYNLDKIFVTARVDETDVNDVHVGQLVDINVDAYSGAPVTGRVIEVQNAAAAVFSLFPESNSSGNFQKVTQVIPVKITLTRTGDRPLVPGMNVTVKIHKH